MTWHRIEPSASQTIGKHSTHLAKMNLKFDSCKFFAENTFPEDSFIKQDILKEWIIKWTMKKLQD